MRMNCLARSESAFSATMTDASPLALGWFHSSSATVTGDGKNLKVSREAGWRVRGHLPWLMDKAITHYRPARDGVQGVGDIKSA